MTQYFGPLPKDLEERDDLKQWFHRQTISAQKLISGAIQVGIEISSANFVAGSSGWQIDGDGNAEFNDVTVRGDIESGNWDGSSPANLASADGGATAGFYFDSSVGAGQMMGDLFVGGDITFLSGGLFKTAASGDRIEIGGSKPYIEFYDATSGLVGQIGWAATGYGADELTIENSSGLGDIVINAAGVIELDADGAAGQGVVVVNAQPAGGAPAVPFRVDGVSGSGFRVQDSNSENTPTWAFDSDTNTGIFAGGADRLDISAGGVNDISFRSGQINSASIRDDTTTSSANVAIGATSGRIQRSTSSLKYKEGWEFVDEEELAKIELPVPITWIDEEDIYLGFGTEHIEQMLPAATQDRNVDGVPENYDVRSLVAILSAKVKRLEAVVGVA